MSLPLTRDALILAAGFGSRLNAEEGHKILARVGGKPMLDHHIEGLVRLGVDRLTIVTGNAHEELEAVLSDWKSPIQIQWIFNPDYALSNGISVLTGAKAIAQAGGQNFWLSMSDHLFDPALFDSLRDAMPAMKEPQGLLAIDLKLDSIYDMPDATKLLLEDGKLRAIGKDIEPFNVVDAGLFWVGKGFLSALEQTRIERGDCSTSDAVKALAQQGSFAFWDVGAHLWQDVDTPGARVHAENLLKRNWT